MLSLTRSKFWLLARSAVYAWSFIGAAVTDSPVQFSIFPLLKPLPLGWIAVIGLMVIAFFAITALGIAAVVSLWLREPPPGGSGRWTKPTHSSSPITFPGPSLSFIHFGGFIAIFMGLGFLVRAILTNDPTYVVGVLTIVVGISTLGGLQFGMACCKDRFESPK